jgi:hypothetical protein
MIVVLPIGMALISLLKTNTSLFQINVLKIELLKASEKKEKVKILRSD